MITQVKCPECKRCHEISDNELSDDGSFYCICGEVLHANKNVLTIKQIQPKQPARRLVVGRKYHTLRSYLTLLKTITLATLVVVCLVLVYGIVRYINSDFASWSIFVSGIINLICFIVAGVCVLIWTHSVDVQIDSEESLRTIAELLYKSRQDR